MKDELVRKWKGAGMIRNERLIEAFRNVPREYFVLDEYEDDAYGDHALPICAGQTISQPSTIMIMLDALDLREEDKVLEIGTGSGYNAALISRIAGKVITTEIISELIDYARDNLKRAGMSNVEVVHSDGSNGYEKEAPYDRIIITAACPEIPKALIDQLKEGGIIVAPVGPLYSQKMVKGVKGKQGLSLKELGDFIFVPLKGKGGYK